MRFLIENNKGKVKVYVSKGSTLNGPRVIYKNYTARRYKKIWSNDPETLNDIEKLDPQMDILYAYGLKVTKHYKDFQEFMEDHIELFL